MISNELERAYDFDVEFYDEVLEIDKSHHGGSFGKYIPVLKDFLASESKTLKFKFPNITSARNCRTSVGSYIRKNNVNAVLYMRGVEIYVIKG